MRDLPLFDDQSVKDGNEQEVFSHSGLAAATPICLVDINVAPRQVSACISLPQNESSSDERDNARRSPAVGVRRVRLGVQSSWHVLRLSL